MQGHRRLLVVLVAAVAAAALAPPAAAQIDLMSCPAGLPAAVPKQLSTCGRARKDYTIVNPAASAGPMVVYTLTPQRTLVDRRVVPVGASVVYPRICKGFQFLVGAEDCAACIRVFRVGSRTKSKTVQIPAGICGTAQTDPPVQTPPTMPADQPNIIFIMGDDIGARDFGFLGGNTIRTPILDALAKKSASFLSAWATPFCRTSRGVVMTASVRYATGHFSQFELPEQSKLYFGSSFGNIAKEAGYKTLFSGKWQIFGRARGTEAQNGYGFDEYTIWGHSDVETFEDLAEKYDGPIPPGGGPPNGPFLREWGRYSHPVIARNDQFVDTNPLNFSSNIFLRHIQEFMRKSRDQGEKSFVYFPMALAHDDWNFDKAEMTWVPMPILDDNGFVVGYQPGEPSFGNMVTYMDTIIGLLMDGLKRDGLYDNTIIFFCTDNGSPSSAESQGFKGRTTDERGVRVPMLVHGANGLIKTRRTRVMFSLVDVVATLAGFMGIPRLTPARPNSIDFSSYLKGDTNKAPRKWSFSFHEDERMIRNRNWIYDSTKTMFNCSKTTNVEDCIIVADVESNPTARNVRAKFDQILAELESTGQADGSKLF